ncbi:WxL protein peptidoglycan domain-containing protein [Cellulomonas sp.]|uniref:WxL protein peptidoglycan domain-containing protein n=1 Tax=Cellulomonas sp. TaxID=40001 RepID=UPI003BAC95DD
MHKTAAHLGAALLTALLVAVGLMAGPAAADDGTAAWSVSPASPEGQLDARTRIDLQLDPGASAHDQVLVANASTVEQTFQVYAADAFNTPDGGYDLDAAATAPRDVGAWVTFTAPTVTIPPLATAVVGFDVAVPAGAAPGDHAGGIVVSQAGPPEDGVVVDARVAVRLGVRVAGALAPALEVRALTASYSGTFASFAPGKAVVRYTLVNTGNVKVVGSPRLRVSGPFGIGRVELAPGNTQEVLPGQSFVVESEIGSVPPLLAMTATADVAMSAAPGPQTEIPLVSSTGRTLFVAVPWAVLLLLVLIAAAVVVVVRWRRARRREGETLWREMVAEAGRSGTSGALAVPESATGSRRQAVGAAVVLLLVVGGLAAGDETVGLSLNVPSAPVSSATPGSGVAPTTPVRGGRRPTVVAPPSSAESVPPAGDAQPDGAPSAAPTPTAEVLAADEVWRPRSAFGPVQWTLLGLAGVAAVLAAGYAIRLVAGRRASGGQS